jgi:hypothetical protein
MTSETGEVGGSRLGHASPLVFTEHFSDLDSSLNVASFSLCIIITVDAECGRVKCDRPEVEMTSETSGIGGSRLDHASPLLFTGHFSNWDSSLNVASISLCISITVEAECGIVYCDRPEVEMTSETSGLGGSRLGHASTLVFTGHFSDLVGSLGVASLSLCISITVEAEALFTYVNQTDDQSLSIEPAYDRSTFVCRLHAACITP